jgi:hypothetical protein
MEEGIKKVKINELGKSAARNIVIFNLIWFLIIAGGLLANKYYDPTAEWGQVVKVISAVFTIYILVILFEAYRFRAMKENIKKSVKIKGVLIFKVPLFGSSNFLFRGDNYLFDMLRRSFETSAEIVWEGVSRQFFIRQKFQKHLKIQELKKGASFDFYAWVDNGDRKAYVAEFAYYDQV